MRGVHSSRLGVCVYVYDREGRRAERLQDRQGLSRHPSKCNQKQTVFSPDCSVGNDCVSGSDPSHSTAQLP